MRDARLKLLAGFLPWTSLLLDGHFGHHNALPMARQSHLQLISTRRCDAALYLPATGPYAGRGPHRPDGRQLDYPNMPAKDLTETTVAGHIHTRVYQAQLRHNEFAQPLNVVIIVKTNRHTRAQAHAILFSRDLPLAYTSLVDDYGLRCQIECNFRDAKQDWGLEDFMHVTPTGVTHAAHLSWFMVNVAYRLQADGRPRDPDDSILDVKADGRGYKYVEEPIHMLPEKPEPVVLRQLLHQVAGLGRMHVSQPSCSFS
jgi:putative transposase